ncbi:DUF2478 domain-containing protein [Bordetella petrii]|uniref:DUF2478 domain-containing protein n=1 Tax=Bordetella petrii TaxID=94624 RepID=UPI00373229AC
MPSSIDSQVPVAALVYRDASRDADALLAAFAADMLARGHRLHGLLQQAAPAPGGGAPRRRLVDLRSGRAYRVSQDLGPGSRACSVDPGGLAVASQVLRAALDARADLAIVNRYGELEAAGSGFAQEMLALMSEGIPLLTVVAARFLPDWRRFTGQAGVELPLERPALQAWFDIVAGPGAAAGAGAAS